MLLASPMATAGSVRLVTPATGRLEIAPMSRKHFRLMARVVSILCCVIALVYSPDLAGCAFAVAALMAELRSR